MNEPQNASRLCPLSGGDFRPIPDPTELTTKQLHNHTAGVREVLESRIAASEKVMDAVWDKMKEFKGMIREEVDQLRELHNVKFEGIQTQFVERDTRIEQTSSDGKVALKAALDAAKEAVAEQNKSNSQAIAKSEAGTTKQFDQIGEINTATNKSTDEKIEEAKKRLGIVEGQLSQLNGRTKGIGDGWGYVVGALGILLSIGTFIAMLLRK